MRKKCNFPLRKTVPLQQNSGDGKSGNNIYSMLKKYANICKYHFFFVTLRTNCTHWRTTVIKITA